MVTMMLPIVTRTKTPENTKPDSPSPVAETPNDKASTKMKNKGPHKSPKMLAKLNFFE